MNDTKAKQLCNKSMECMYDYLTTKNDDIAKNTKIVMEIAEENTEFRGKNGRFLLPKNIFYRKKLLKTSYKVEFI